MPVLRYFVVVGAVLAGLLFVADATLSPPDEPMFTAAFDQNPARTGIVLSTDLAPAATRVPASAPVPSAVAPSPVTVAAAPSTTPAANVAPAPDTAAAEAAPQTQPEPRATSQIKSQAQARKRTHAAARRAQARRDEMREQRIAERAPWQEWQDDGWGERRSQYREPSAQNRRNAQARRQHRDWNNYRSAARSGTVGDPWNAFAFAPRQRMPSGYR